MLICINQGNEIYWVGTAPPKDIYTLYNLQVYMKIWNNLIINIEYNVYTRIWKKEGLIISGYPNGDIKLNIQTNN